MKQFRKIMVNDITYKWLFCDNRLDCRNNPTLLIVNEAFPKKYLKLEFSIASPYMLNCGLPAFYQGDRTVINLNRPKLILLIIQYCICHEDDILWKRHNMIDGISLLQKMGFEISQIYLE